MLRLIGSLFDFALRVLRKLEWAGPLLVRIVVGIAMAKDGWGKLHHLDAITAYFGPGDGPDHLNIPFPGINALIVSCVECFGGIALILGLGTRIASALMIGVFAVATLTAKIPGLESTELLDQIAELTNTIEVTYIAMFVWLLVAGPGPVSIDRLLRRSATSRVGEAP